MAQRRKEPETNIKHRQVFPRDDPWTAGEKALRDAFFKKIGVTRALSFPQAANCMTVLGIALLGFALYDYWRTASLLRQVYILGFAWITDIMDGPIARNNNAVTALGTALDHTRDYAILSWMILLALFNAGRVPTALQTIYALYATSVAALLVILCRHLCRYRAFRNHAASSRITPPNELWQAEHTFAQFLRLRANTTFVARCCMVFFAVGSSMFFVGIELNAFALAVAGFVTICLHLIALGAYLFESFLEPHQQMLFYRQLLRKRRDGKQRGRRARRGRSDSGSTA